MKTFLAGFLLLLAFASQAQTQVPSGVDCMKKAKGLGVSMLDAYQACSVNSSVKSCVFKQLQENKNLGLSKKELKAQGKQAIKDCQA